MVYLSDLAVHEMNNFGSLWTIFVHFLNYSQDVDGKS